MGHYLDLARGALGGVPDRETSEVSEEGGTQCAGCGGPLTLPESQALGRCCRCMSEAEWIDTLASLRLRRERTRQAVAARLGQLGMDGAA